MQAIQVCVRRDPLYNVCRRGIIQYVVCMKQALEDSRCGRPRRNVDNGALIPDRMHSQIDPASKVSENTAEGRVQGWNA